MCTTFGRIRHDETCTLRVTYEYKHSFVPKTRVVCRCLISGSIVQQQCPVTPDAHRTENIIRPPYKFLSSSSGRYLDVAAAGACARNGRTIKRIRTKRVVPCSFFVPPTNGKDKSSSPPSRSYVLPIVFRVQTPRRHLIILNIT